MAIKMMTAAAGLILLAGVSAPASAGETDHGVRMTGAPTTWVRMSRYRKNAHRARMPRNGAGAASSSAPNGVGYGMGPTGQPSGVK